MTPADALAELVAGNERFVGGAAVHPNQDAARRAALADSQEPFAVVFGCSDSRLAAEIIFDRGLGDLFVVRTAGHAADAAVLGSIEYAVTVLRTPLVVVLGHSSCGAVTAARDAVLTGDRPGGRLGEVVDAIAPSVREAASRGLSDVDQIVDVHVRRTVAQLQDGCAALATAVEEDRCAVVGMSYSLAAGVTRVLGAGPSTAR